MGRTISAVVVLTAMFGLGASSVLALDPPAVFSVAWSLPSADPGRVALVSPHLLAMTTWWRLREWGRGEMTLIGSHGGKVLARQASEGQLSSSPHPYFEVRNGTEPPFQLGSCLVYVDGAKRVRSLSLADPTTGPSLLFARGATAFRAVDQGTAVALFDEDPTTSLAVVLGTSGALRARLLPLSPGGCILVETFAKPPAILVGRSVQTEPRMYGVLECFSLLNGHKLWSSERLAPRPRVSRLGDRGVCVVAGADLVALDASRGTTRWRLPLDGEKHTALAVGDDVLVFEAVGRGSQRLRLLDGASGDERWRSELADHWPDLEGVSMAAVSGDGIFVGFEGGFLARLSLRNGTLTAVGNLDRRVYDLLPLSEQSVIVKSDVRLARLDLGRDRLSDVPASACEIWRSSVVNFGHGEVRHHPGLRLVTRREHKHEGQLLADIITLTSDSSGTSGTPATFPIGIDHEAASDGVNLWGLEAADGNCLVGWIPATGDPVPYLPLGTAAGVLDVTAARGLVALRRRDAIEAWSTGTGDPTTSGLAFLWSRPLEAFSSRQTQLELVQVQNGATSNRFILRAPAAVMAVESRSGDVAWHRPTVMGEVYQAALVDGVLALRGANGRVEALDMVSGRTRWRLDDVSSLFGARTTRFVAALADGRLVTVGPESGRLDPLPAGLEALGRLIGCTESLLLLVTPDGCLVGVRTAEDHGPASGAKGGGAP